ncbi:Uu.00g078520.m01.CDS01 [Anthostomella pinea]|uniref:Uu.00g078520.m01.CDS01 n=1 Tax=Anthostomella pinea TaxID=933095 RepID=A0AAI8VKM0_9PEZI|nr:Uu.00g078520.m01.CDS01 [Anthostomella pinea]
MNPPQAMDGASLQRALVGYQRMSEIVRREMLEPEAVAGGDNNTLRKTMESGIRVLSRRYAATNHPIELFEAEIRDIWYMFTVAAQNIEAHHPAQDRLLRIIMRARHRGVLQRMTHEGGQLAMTSQGRIWVDLPFLVQDVRSAWKKVMEPPALFDQRRNLTSAIARLASSGVCGHKFSQCGLEIMKLALEVAPMPPSSSDSSYGSGHSEEDLALVEIWLSYAGEDLLRLCLTASTDSDSSWSLDGQDSVGPLARQAGVEPTAVYSRERFLFWKDRLARLTAEAELESAVEAWCAHMITGVWDDYFGILPF